MKKILLIIVSLFAAIILNAQIDNYIDEFTSDSAFRHAAISICFRDAVSGEIIADHNSNIALSSASIMKLVSTSAALEILGPAFRFSTHIGYTGNFNISDSTLNGHIIIRGGADPTLLSEYFPDHNSNLIALWGKAILDQGIRKVNGRIIADASVFDYNPAARGWTWEDLGNYYGAGPHGISIYDNMYRIHLKSGPEGSKPEITYIEPEIPGLLVENLLISKGNKDNGYVFLEPYGSRAIIRGEIPVDKDDFVLKASISDPPQLCAGILNNFLIKAGAVINDPPTSLRVSSHIADEFISSRKVICTTTYSPTIAEIIKVTNTESVNLFAEHLVKYLGHISSNKENASLQSGLQLVGEFLEQNLDNSNGLYMTDGSGLSRSNAISSAFITNLLHYMKERSNFSDVFYNSLPEAGKAGTLESYFKDSVFENNLRAKSGTATRIRNYAGYFTTTNGDKLAFAVLVNNFDCTSRQVTQHLEQLLKKVILNYRPL